MEALLAGVRHHGVGKWAAILRHSKVFNGVRTSVDLKDKWRNLTSPVRAAALAAHAPIEHGDAAIALQDDNEEGVALHDGMQTSPPCSPAQSRSPSPMEDGIPCSPDHSLSDVLSLSHAQDMPPELQSQDPSQAHSQCNSQSHSQLQDPAHSHSQSNSQSHSHAIHEKLPGKPQPEPELRNGHIVLPPPPSESSVSPEVLSTPSGQQAPGNGQAQQQHGAFSATQPPAHSFQQQAGFPLPPIHHPHVVMQHAIGQSLYHSAAALAAYWRRLGHEPNAYAIAAALTTSSATPHVHPYYGGTPAQALYHDDEDDDDDEDVQPAVPMYPFPYSSLYNKDAAHMPYNPSFAQSFPMSGGHVFPSMSPTGPDTAHVSTTGASAQVVKSEDCVKLNSSQNTDKCKQVIVTGEDTPEVKKPVTENIKPEKAHVTEVAKAESTAMVDGADGDDEVMPETTSGLEYLNAEEFPAKAQVKPNPDREHRSGNDQNVRCPGRGTPLRFGGGLCSDQTSNSHFL